MSDFIYIIGFPTLILISYVIEEVAKKIWG